MSRNIYLISLFCVISIFTYSQVNSLNIDTLPKVEKSLYKVNFYIPGFEYEYGIGKLNTLNFLITFGAAWVPENKNQKSAFFLSPVLMIELRNYYNLMRRMKKNKNTKNNTGNFFALCITQQGRSLIWNPGYISYSVTYYGALWGFQRTWADRYNITFGFGVDYFVNENGVVGFSPLLEYKTGFVFGKKKKNNVKLY